MLHFSHIITDPIALWETYSGSNLPNTDDKADEVHLWWNNNVVLALDGYALCVSKKLSMVDLSEYIARLVVCVADSSLFVNVG